MNPLDIKRPSFPDWENNDRYGKREIPGIGGGRLRPDQEVVCDEWPVSI